jgi:hypothetical protein
MGSDTHPGTLAQPLRTLAKARDLVRTINGSMSSEITVYLHGGTYPVTSTVVFSNADSGQNGFYVKYLAYPGEQPLITGGQPITGWTIPATGNGVYTARGITTPFRQLYINGVKAVRARTPNLGTNGAPAFNRLTGADNTAQNIQVASSEVSSWNNFTKVEMHVGRQHAPPRLVDGVGHHSHSQDPAPRTGSGSPRRSDIPSSFVAPDQSDPECADR